MVLRCCCWRLRQPLCLDEVKGAFFTLPLHYFCFSFVKIHLLIRFQGKPLGEWATLLQKPKSSAFKNIEWAFYIVVFSYRKHAWDSLSSAFYTKRSWGAEQSSTVSAVKWWQSWAEHSAVDLLLGRTVSTRPRYLPPFLLSTALIF